MPSIINLQLSESTATHPFKFFDAFYKPDVLNRVRSNFFEALRPIDETSYLFYPHEKEDLIKIEYTIEDYDPDDPMGTYRRWQEVKTFEFPSELNKFLQQAYFSSLKLLEDRMEKLVKADSKRSFLKNEVEKISSHLDFIQTNIDSAKYTDVLNLPLNNIIKTIYNDYPLYKPSAPKNIADILKGTTVDYTPTGVKTSLAKAIMHFSVAGSPVFFKDKFNEEQYEKVRKRLVNFITGNFSEIDAPIEFTNNIEAVHYLIYRIAESNSFKLKTFEDCKIIILKKASNSNYFKADTCSKGKSSFEKKHGDLRKEIEALIHFHSE